MVLELSAISNPKHIVQLSITTTDTSKEEDLVSSAYILLNAEEIDSLIFALLERKLGLISATDSIKSNLIPSETINT